MNLVFAVIHALAPLGLTALWVGSIGWTAADARRRCDSDRARAAIAAAVVFPLVGAGLYALLRPCRSPLEDRERRVWRRYLEAQLEPGDRCLACLTPLDPTFRCCPGCGDALHHDCRSCGRELRIGWRSCPWCLEPVLEPVPEPVREPAVARSAA